MMADYKKLYIHLFRAVTKSIDILVKAQQECEEMYISSQEPELTILPDGRPEAGGEPQEEHKGH